MSDSPLSMEWTDGTVSVHLGNALDHYRKWKDPTVIVSDGAYGIAGFAGDPSDHRDLRQWYLPHVKAWSDMATPQTTLWFWNSEIGWATVHPILEQSGWRYSGINIWNKGKGHVAGNVNTATIRKFPVVSEVCAQYVFEPRIGKLTLQEWLRAEWQRSGLPLEKANEACGVADAATRKYLCKDSAWYPPSPETFEKLHTYATLYGRADGRPYFSLDGVNPATGEECANLRTKFHCPYGTTNVWDRPALRNGERIKSGGKTVHPNQKPLDLIIRIIEASSDPGDTVWEPFGGLFTACLAARTIHRHAFGSEIDPAYFDIGIGRLSRIKGVG